MCGKNTLFWANIHPCIGPCEHLCFLSGFQLVEAGAQEDLVLLLRVVELVPLAPVVAHGVRKYLPVLGPGVASQEIIFKN